MNDKRMAEQMGNGEKGQRGQKAKDVARVLLDQ